MGALFDKALHVLLESKLLKKDFNKLSAKEIDSYLHLLDDVFKASKQDGVVLSGIRYAKIMCRMADLYFLKEDYRLAAETYRFLPMILIRDGINIGMHTWEEQAG